MDVLKKLKKYGNLTENEKIELQNNWLAESPKAASDKPIQKNDNKEKETKANIIKVKDKKKKENNKKKENVKKAKDKNDTKEVKTSKPIF